MMAKKKPPKLSANGDVIQGGGSAVIEGKKREREVIDNIKSYGYVEFTYNEWLKLGKPIGSVVKQYQYENIYTKKGFLTKKGKLIIGRADILIVTDDNCIIIIECKWQTEEGSVDEKYLHFFTNLVRMPADYVIVVIGGDGYKDAAMSMFKQWCADYSKANINETIVLHDDICLNITKLKDKIIKVLTFDEFKKSMRHELNEINFATINDELVMQHTKNDKGSKLVSTKAEIMERESNEMMSEFMD